MDENKVADQIKQFQELAKDNKNIDVASLAAAAFEQQNKNSLSAKLRRTAYFVSIAFPPFGLLFALKFWFTEKDDAQTAAMWCVILTAVSIILFLIFMRVFIGSTGMTYQQLQQSPEQLQQLLQ